MLSFQKLRVYQSSIEFLALVLKIINALPRGHAELADQLLRLTVAASQYCRGSWSSHRRRSGSFLYPCAWISDGSCRRVRRDASHEAGQRNLVHSRHRTSRRHRCDAHNNDLISSTSRSKAALMFRFTSRSTSMLLASSPALALAGTSRPTDAALEEGDCRFDSLAFVAGHFGGGHGFPLGEDDRINFEPLDLVEIRA